MLAATDPGVIVAFGAGMLSFLSPCVLPLVPGYLSLMTGIGTSELGGSTATRTIDRVKVLRSTLLFVAGFTVVFTALGASASALSRTLLEHQRGLNQIAGVIVIIAGVLVAGVVSPRILQRERRFHVSPSALGSYGAPVMGMAFAFGWSPCIGPVLAGVLSLAAAEATVTRGVTLLLAYSLGLGVPFVLAGLAFARLTGAFDWVKRHFRVINAVAGAMLIGFGILLVTDNVFWLSRQLVDLMEAVGLDWLTQI